MRISFKAETKKNIVQMYNDMVDAYVDEKCKHSPTPVSDRKSMVRDAKEWKLEFKLLLDELYS